ncbi:MAG: serine/threonine-protein phosphatase [Alphaproteobacteria bacterium]|nr:serine/threonine-protein phosphatase [Alphaproteobacteria bacterium]
MPGFGFVSAAVTDIGLVRRRNEDAYLDRPDLGLWAVADGMGGHEAGDYASARIVEALNEIDRPDDPTAFAGRVCERLIAVDAELRKRAAMLGSGAVIGSTVIVLIAAGAGFACVWAGDSRLYRRRAGVLVQLSTDHSRVRELVSRGLLREEEAESHPAAHIVTRAIGAGPVQPEIIEGEVCPGDVFLLCSDGLTRMLGASEIAAQLAGPPESAATRLRDLVLARGAVDNVTIVIVQVHEATAHDR